MMQCRYAHPRHGCEFFDTQGLRVVHPEPFARLCSPVALLAKRGDSAEMLSLRTATQAEYDLALDQAAEKWNVLWRVQQIHESGTCIQIGRGSWWVTVQ